MNPIHTLKYCATANSTVSLLWFAIAINTKGFTPFVLGIVWTAITAVNVAVWYTLRRKELAP